MSEKSEDKDTPTNAKITRTDISSILSLVNNSTEEFPDPFSETRDPFESDEIDPDENVLTSIIMDLSLEEKSRIKALDMYYNLKGADETVELINKLAMMYELSGTRAIKTYLFDICKDSNISPFLKSIGATALCSKDGDNLGYKAIDLIFPQLGEDVGTPYKIDLIKLLMKSPEYKQQARDHFFSIINDEKIDCNYRYKAILSLEHKPEKKDEPTKEDLLTIEKMKYFISESCLEFIKNNKNKTMLRILAGQYLLKTHEEKCDSEVERILISFARDESLEYNLRADATDVILQLGTEESKKVARDIIMELGKLGRTADQKNVNTLYNNAQNVHTKEIEDSVRDALEFLQTFKIMEYKGKTIDAEFVERKLSKHVKKEDEEKVRVAFNRIIMDRALYGKYNCTLAHILIQVWTYISGHKNKKEMRKRLIEELVEMAGTCSSGFASRLINTISGFGDFSFRISWRDQITANFTGRLNALIRNMDDLNLQEKVLSQMTIDSSKYEDRKHFLKFFRRSIPVIRAELYTEFKPHITDADFDLYFRSALSMYESGTMAT